MRVKVILMVEGRKLREWDFVHDSHSGVVETDEFKIDLLAIDQELHGDYRDREDEIFHRSILRDKVTMKVEMHP